MSIKNKKTNCTIFLFVIILAIFVYLFYSIKKANTPLNVILISVDTLRADHMGIYGYKKNTTPNIDKWAKDATVFTNVYVTDPYTYPSFVSFMTGLHPLSTKIITNGKGPLIGSKTQTLTKILKQNNYSTTAYITNGWLGPQFSNLNEGFDEYHVFDDNNFLWKTKNRRKNYDDFINKAILSLEKNISKKQFLWIHLMDPHWPYYPPDDLRCSFLTKEECIQAQGKTMLEIISKDKDYYRCSSKEMPKSQLDLHKGLYDGDVTQADKLVGKILNKIQSLGLEKNSMVILYSDHGEGLDHKFYLTHGGVLYNSNTHIPLIIKYPQVRTITNKDNRLIDNTDIFPTILDLLGMRKKELLIDGKSFSAAFKKTMLDMLASKFWLRKQIFSTDYNGMKFSLFDGRYKYIYSQKTSCLFNNQTEELYDLKQDPQENKNLVVTRHLLAGKMKNILFNHLQRYNYPQPEKTSELDNTFNDNKAPPALNNKILEQLKSLGY